MILILMTILLTRSGVDSLLAERLTRSKAAAPLADIRGLSRLGRRLVALHCVQTRALRDRRSVALGTQLRFRCRGLDTASLTLWRCGAGCRLPTRSPCAKPRLMRGADSEPVVAHVQVRRLVRNAPSSSSENWLGWSPETHVISVPVGCRCVTSKSHEPKTRSGC